MVLIVTPPHPPKSTPTGWSVSVVGGRWELPLTCPDMKKGSSLHCVVYYYSLYWLLHPRYINCHISYLGRFKDEIRCCWNRDGVGDESAVTHSRGRVRFSALNLRYINTWRDRFRPQRSNSPNELTSVMICHKKKKECLLTCCAARFRRMHLRRRQPAWQEGYCLVTDVHLIYSFYKTKQTWA